MGERKREKEREREGEKETYYRSIVANGGGTNSYETDLHCFYIYMERGE